MALDMKIDDGLPYSGNVFVTSENYIGGSNGYNGHIPGSGWDATNNCATFTTNTYGPHSAGTPYLCALDIKAAF